MKPFGGLSVSATMMARLEIATTRPQWKLALSQGSSELTFSLRICPTVTVDGIELNSAPDAARRAAHPLRGRRA